jgi:Cu/Ag efflux protein CusF
MKPKLFSPLSLENVVRRTLMKLSKAILASAVISVISTAALAEEATGKVTKVDKQKGTISIQLTQGGTVGVGSGAVQKFKAQDRLLFNELRPGDKVIFDVFQANGTKTITKLNKEGRVVPSAIPRPRPFAAVAD